MSINRQSMSYLSKSLLASALVVVCSGYSMERADTVAGAVRWASVVTILGMCYYLKAQVCARLWLARQARRGGARYKARYERTAGMTDLDPSAREAGRGSPVGPLSPMGSDMEADLGPGAAELRPARSVVYYPELTMGSVWTYVYGWGLLLFVSVYCTAAIDVPASCWWMMGMVALSFDELISQRVGNGWVVLLGACLGASIFTLWSGSLVDPDGNIVADGMFSARTEVIFLNFIMGVVFPVAVPFIFFTVRTTIRAATMDVRSLCEFAMPFMAFLALCCLAATSGMCGYAPVSDGVDAKLDAKLDAWHAKLDANLDAMEERGGLRRELVRSGSDSNGTVMIETVAKFASSYLTNLDNSSFIHKVEESHIVNYFLLFLSPFATLALVRVLIASVLSGHTTEFITAFLLVVTTRYGVTHHFDLWAGGSMGAAGVAFVLILLVRR